jgi:RNA polymerase sigma-70 factor, ECF subfamily
MTASLESVREQLIELLPRLRRFARTLARQYDDADDLVQIALERALMRYEQWDPGSRLDSWMFGIIRNAWIDEVRARQRRGPHFDVEEISETASSGPHGMEIDMMSVQEALARLPEEQRTAITLVLVEGLSYKEAAAAMQVPIGTLTSRLARGREALTALLSTDPPAQEHRP